MANPSKRKGSAFELDVVRYLQANGHPYAERTYGAGRPDDRGDIDGIPGWVIECKNEKSTDLAGWCTEAAAEAVNARRSWWAAIAKRRNRPVCDSYVVMTLAQFARLVGDSPATEVGAA
jgi:hypothetical protein